MMGTETTGRADVVVVGGGIIGLAVAERLQRRGRGVLVLERGRVGCGATWAAGGMLAPVSEAELIEDAIVELGLDSLRRYRPWVRGLERGTGLACGYRDEGILWVATNRDDAEELDHLEETLRRRGLASTRLGGAAVREREPHLSGRTLAGLLLSDDHQVDPRALAVCLEQAVRDGGGRVVSGATVSAVEARSGRVGTVAGRTREGRDFRIEAGQVVVATGAWTCRDLELPVETDPIRPVKGQLVRLRGEPLLSHVVRTPDVYLIPRASGELLVGATMEEMGFDDGPTAGAAMDLLRHAWEAVPGVYDLALAEVSVGLRSASEDHRPRIGPTEIDGLFLAVGHYRNGILLAAATGEHLAAMMDGEAPHPAVAPFVPHAAAANDARAGAAGRRAAAGEGGATGRGALAGLPARRDPSPESAP